MIKYLHINKDGFSIKESENYHVSVTTYKNKLALKDVDSNQHIEKPFVDVETHKIETINKVIDIDDDYNDEIKRILYSDSMFYDIMSTKNIDGTTSYKFTLNYFIMNDNPVYDIVDYYKSEIKYVLTKNKSLNDTIKSLENDKNTYLSEIDKYKKLYSSHKVFYDSPLLYQIIFLLKVWVLNLFKFK